MHSWNCKILEIRVCISFERIYLVTRLEKKVHANFLAVCLAVCDKIDQLYTNLMRNLLTILFQLTTTTCPWVHTEARSFKKNQLFVLSNRSDTYQLLLRDYQLARQCVEECAVDEVKCLTLCESDASCVFDCIIGSSTCSYNCPCYDGCPLGCEGAVFFFLYCLKTNSSFL